MANKKPVVMTTGELEQIQSGDVLDPAFVPESGVLSVVASEALADGDLVNIWINTGVANVRKADGATTGKWADGYVLAAYASSATAVVYTKGVNTHMTCLTVGKQRVSTWTAGKTQSTMPATSGHTAQEVGFALTTTSMLFVPGIPIARA